MLVTSPLYTVSEYIGYMSNPGVVPVPFLKHALCDYACFVTRMQGSKYFTGRTKPHLDIGLALVKLVASGMENKVVIEVLDVY